jgi:hypothetical protein
LRGTDAKWDYARLVGVGRISLETGVEWLTADFNCTVRDPAYVNDILDRLAVDHPDLHQMILYVEQPFPYELEVDRIDVRSLAARKPLFLDESAHDWQHVRLGLELGWTGVALKTCKTLSGALLSACWAQAHGMALMVQDLTNPMLAQISHVGLAGPSRRLPAPQRRRRSLHRHRPRSGLPHHRDSSPASARGDGIRIGLSTMSAI